MAHHFLKVHAHKVAVNALDGADAVGFAHMPPVLLALPGDNCIKIGLPGKLILSKRKGLREVLFS